jgi:multiple antibiotic resistance protein
LLTGPGTISTVIIYSGHAHGWWAYLSLVICALLIALACYVAMIARLRYAHQPWAWPE